MLKFYETPCDALLTRTFALDENGVPIGSVKLVYIATGATDGRIEVRDFILEKDDPALADLMAGAVLNAACNTEVAVVRTDKAAHWSRFGLRDYGDYLEQRTERIVFDSVCKSADCAHCDIPCKEKHE